ncbi:MAG: hypothetical protein HY236_16675 [Acidobacteria bacterium]|nr:hypothetical protein [Acidobacteriota bacterium]
MATCSKIRLQAGKTAYNEEEAAHALGVSMSRFRSLVVLHLRDRHSVGALQLTRFHPSDLLFLSLLGRLHSSQEAL